MFTQGLCLLPVFLVIWSSFTFIVSYMVSVFRHDVDALFPYISDTAAQPPESCIFGLMTIVSAFAGTATIFARYKYVGKLSADINVGSPRLNTAACWLGMIACLGMCIVATFQEFAVTVVHLLGAGMFFFCGVLYLILQSIISYKALPLGSSWCVLGVQAGIAFIAFCAIFPTAICGFLANRKDTHSDPKDKDYPLYLASTVCEWIVTFSFVFFFLTYIHDFKRFTLRVVTECEDGPPTSSKQEEKPSAVHF